MSLKISSRFVIGAIAAISSFSASADPIELKGLQVGMTKEEVNKKFPSFEGFTIAGVSSKYSSTPVKIEYRDNKLDFLLFFFDSENFSTVLAAVKEKYPELKCIDSEVSNGMGAKFSQVDCTLSDSVSTLSLSRFVSDVQTSSLTIISKKLSEQINNESKQKMKDV